MTATFEGKFVDVWERFNKTPCRGGRTRLRRLIPRLGWLLSSVGQQAVESIEIGACCPLSEVLSCAQCREFLRDRYVDELVQRSALCGCDFLRLSLQRG